MRLVVAVGGNALLRRDEPPEARTQVARLGAAAPVLADLARDHQVVLVHGNGPQIGLLARQNAEDRRLNEPYSLSALGAETQGLIGSSIQQALHAVGLRPPPVTLITHTLVDAAHPAMARPARLIGPVYSRQRAHELAAAYGWAIRPDGRGWRRVVGSPPPEGVVELDAARSLLDTGETVVLGGGGGVPLDRRTGQPVEAIIDKDLVAAFIAARLDADRLVILTDVPGVMSDYDTAEATVVAAAAPPLLRRLRLDPWSMGPKVEAACSFTELTGRPSAIGALHQAPEVVAGVLGTQIAPGG